MGITIFYFSGTGNSLRVAKDIAAGTGGTLCPIAAMADHGVVKVESETIGIVFPVYYGELPVIVKRFAERLDDVGHRYIFAVCTFGGSAGCSLTLLKRIIQARGGDISATYRVHMPQNSFLKRWENHAKLYSTWNKQIEQVVDNTAKRRKGEFFKHVFLAPVFMLSDYVVKLMKPSYRKAFIKLSNAPSDLETDDLIYLNDTSYRVNEKCSGCGVCSRVCPVGNIEMTDKRPVWLHHCENCLACYNWCPTKAIQGGIASDGYFYRHPDITTAEIMKQRTDRPAECQAAVDDS